ncbi:MAG TPA: YceI family protein [Chloroflexota bacterium]|nr:YceI family protein [Chloroflexota bacterium]
MFRSRYSKAALATASAAMMLAAAACGRPSLAPAAKLTEPATAVQTAQQAPSSTSQTSASSAPAAAGTVALTFDSGNSKAEYQTQEQLAGRNLPNVAVGSTTGVQGSIVLTSDSQLDGSASKITVDLSSLASDESMRDNFIKRNTLQTSQYPDAVFTPTGVSGLPAALPTSGSLTFQLDGNLTVHGVTKPVTWTVEAQFDGSQISGKATAPFTITEFGMSLPKAGPVLSVQDAGTLELDFSNVALSAAA